MSEPQVHLQLEPKDPVRLQSLCGPFDENLKLLERRLHVHITYRGHRFTLAGESHQINAVAEIIRHLYRETKAENAISPDMVHLYIRESEADDIDTHTSNQKETLIRTPKLHIKPRSGNQTRYVKAILNHDINFGVGPAGTGKTYLAVACAAQALAEDRVKRIMLVRPAVEAGEKLGFLPGDLAQKVDPYLRPLYDALYEMFGFEQVNRLLEKGLIEIAPLAFMRGRTLNNSFVILDESQNTTPEQMKMFLTRIGFGSTAVITGDTTQIDLGKGVLSGLIQSLRVLDKVEGISTTYFKSKDVVRHPLVQRIVDAYANYQDPQE